MTSRRSLLSIFLRAFPLSLTMRFSKYFLAFTFGIYDGVFGLFFYKFEGKMAKSGLGESKRSSVGIILSLKGESAAFSTYNGSGSATSIV